MALEIRTIPTLRGKEAKRFVKMAEEAEKKPKSQDFSKQVEITQKILKDIIIQVMSTFTAITD